MGDAPEAWVKENLLVARWPGVGLLYDHVTKEPKSFTLMSTTKEEPHTHLLSLQWVRGLVVFRVYFVPCTFRVCHSELYLDVEKQIRSPIRT